MREDVVKDGLFLVRGSDGKRFIFGEPLKERLSSAIRGPDGKLSRPVVTTDQNARLWERAAGGAQAAGINASEFPSTGGR